MRMHGKKSIKLLQPFEAERLLKTSCSEPFKLPNDV